MSDLVVYIPNHGYSNDDPVFVSWLNGVYYVDDKRNSSFKLQTTTTSGIYVQYTSDITSGFVRYDNLTPSAVITGLDYLNGETVYVTSNGELIGSYIVSGGSITLSSSITTYQIGLPYVMKAVTMRLAAPSHPDALQARIKRISNVAVRYVRSKGLQTGNLINGIEYLNDLYAGFSREAEDAQILARGGFDTNSFVVIKSDKPYPATILAIVTEFETE